MRILKWLVSYFEEVVSGAALIMMTAIVVANVIARYVFSAAFSWGEELVGAFSVWCVFLGAAACYKRGMHIGIDVVVQALPAFPQRIVRVFVTLVVMITTAYLSYLSLVFSLAAWIKRTQVLEIRYTFIDIPAFIGFGLMTVYAVRELVAAIRGSGAATDAARGSDVDADQGRERLLLEV